METAPETEAAGRGSDMTSILSGQQSPREPTHFCRGCGSKLPVGFRGIYHKECLRADKRLRTCARRRREQEMFKRWLAKQHCPHCGRKYDDQRAEGNVEPLCEASPALQGRDSPD